MRGLPVWQRWDAVFHILSRCTVLFQNNLEKKNMNKMPVLHSIITLGLRNNAKCTMTAALIEKIQ